MPEWLRREEESVDAVALYRRALETAHAGNWEDALPLFARAHAAGIDEKLFYYNYATVYVTLARFAEALPLLERCVQLDGEYIPALNNYAVCLSRLLRIADSESVLRQILCMQPGHPEALTNLAGCLKDQGRTREAADLYRQALAQSPGYAVAGSNLLLCLHSHETDGIRIRAEHEAVAVQITSSVIPSPLHLPKPAAKEKIRVGFVSPDFHLHSVAYFALPLIAHLDRSRFSVYCYSDVPTPDAVTGLFVQHADVFRPVFGKGDAEVAEIVRSDNINVLIDLAGHTSGGRPGLFASRAAPVQISWLGYPGTSGMAAMDWRLTDTLADPAGFERFYTEKLFRLPSCFLCYGGAADAPLPTPPPAAACGYITFGSFNNASKIQPETVKLWAAVLKAVPQSRMIIKSKPFGDPRLCARLLALFAHEGIAPEQVELRGFGGSTATHLEMYGDIDIALDSWPYNGTTTTCEALWMGVPVVSLTGPVHASRVGSSILNAVGLRSLAVESVESFVRMAASLASDVDRLGGLRGGLRGSMARSALCSPDQFAADFAAALQEIIENSSI